MYQRGKRAHGKWLIVVALRRPDGGHRVGLSVSKAHGGAVRRNKIKRILREAFRLERPNLPGRFDMVLIPQKREGKYVLDEMRKELRALVQQLDAPRPRKKRRERDT